MKTSVKRFLTLLLSLVLIASFVPTPVVHAAENQNDYGILLTDEPSMPTVSANANNAQVQNTGRTLEEQRAIWLEEIIDYNENYYGQAVTNVTEDTEKYTLYFEPKAGLEPEAVVLDYEPDDIEIIDEEKWGVSRIEYIKPESVSISPVPNTAQLNSRITVGGTTYDYKFTYYYAWSDGYCKVASKNFASFLSIATDVLMAFTTDNTLKFVRWVIGQAVHGDLDSIEQNIPITAETYNKYFYENKVCSVKPTTASYWYPTCQIGRRLAFGWCWATTKDPVTGEPHTPRKGYGKDGNGIPPTNYDSQAKKNHFDDNTWMINKAIERMTTGGYADVYALCMKEE